LPERRDGAGLAVQPRSAPLMPLRRCRHPRPVSRRFGLCGSRHDAFLKDVRGGRVASAACKSRMAASSFARARGRAPAWPDVSPRCALTAACPERQPRAPRFFCAAIFIACEPDQRGERRTMTAGNTKGVMDDEAGVGLFVRAGVARCAVSRRTTTGRLRVPADAGCAARSEAGLAPGAVQAGVRGFGPRTGVCRPA
jgi:hypothetical protein